MYVNVAGVCWQQKPTDVCEDGTINLLLVSNGAVMTGGRVVDRTDRQKETGAQDGSPRSQSQPKQTHH